MQNYLVEIETIISKAGRTVPEQRKAFNRGFSFSQYNFNIQLDRWDFIYNNTDLHKAKMFSIYFLEKHHKNKDHMMEAWPVIKLWQDKIKRWETSDAISKIYAQLLEYNPKLILPTLGKWNRSNNFWHRRQSIVSLLYYASSRKQYLPFDTMIELVIPLLDDKAHYVQRGVGWTLKEMWKIYPSEQEEFVFAHANKISSMVYTTSTEKWDKPKREELKVIRKTARKRL